MLVRFICENFLSFDKEMEFLNTAYSRSSKLKNHIYREKDGHIPILKGTVLYGANASGKSNFFKAINFSKKLVLNYKKEINIYNILSTQNKFNNSKKTKFEYEFKIGKNIFNYGFVLSSEEVLEEWLYKKGLNKKSVEKPIFIRNKKDIFDNEEINRIVSKEKKDKNFINYSIKALKQNQLFLHRLKEDNIKYIEQFFEWFRKIILVTPKTSAKSISIIKDDVFNFIKKCLPNLDNRIDNIELEKNQIFKAKDIIDTPITLAEKIFNALESSPNGVCFIDGTPMKKGKTFLLKENDKIFQIEISIQRKDKSFALKEESDGINRLFDLIPFLFDLKNNNKIYLIDEIENSLHPHISKTIIKMFYEFTKNKESQLIFSTHDTNLMDLKLMRKDEIWFVEKDKNMNTNIYSLAEFKIRDDLVPSRGYLQGRFGTIPFLGEWKKLCK